MEKCKRPPTSLEIRRRSWKIIKESNTAGRSRSQTGALWRTRTTWQIKEKHQHRVRDKPTTSQCAAPGHQRSSVCVCECVRLSPAVVRLLERLPSVLGKKKHNSAIKCLACATTRVLIHLTRQHHQYMPCVTVIISIYKCKYHINNNNNNNDNNIITKLTLRNPITSRVTLIK